MENNKPLKIPKQLIWQAWLRVKKNAGAAGVDKQDVKAFEEKLRGNLYKLWNRMSSGSYHPPTIMGVAIPKKTGGQRILGIPTVTDRIAQTVVKIALEPRLEKVFLPDSYGYRPNKSAHQAIEITRKRCWRNDWVLEFDIKGMFDNINHELLIKAVKYHTTTKWIIMYIKRWIKAPMEKGDGTVIKRDKGVSQGGCISPLLSNLFMHYTFDIWMQRKHPQNQWCRYADDGLVHCKTESEAHNIKEELKKRFKQCGLELHLEKTRIVYCKDANRRENHPETEFDFLGFTFRRRRARNQRTKMTFVSFLPAISKKASKEIKRIIRYEWRLNSHTHLTKEEIARKMNPIIEGWIRYYGKYYVSQLNGIAEQIDRRLVIWSRCKYKKLKMHKVKACKWIERTYKENPELFAHWKMRKGVLMGAV